MFKTLFFISSFVTCIFYVSSSAKAQSVNGQNNMLTSAEKNNGWVLLFDGKTTKGWHPYNKNSVTNNCKVADADLVLDPKLKDNDHIGAQIHNNE